MKPVLHLLASIALATCASAAFAHGKVECKAYPQSEWRPHTELEQKLVKEGWKIRRMEKTDTCYEVYAKTPTASAWKPSSTPRRLNAWRSDA